MDPMRSPEPAPDTLLRPPGDGAAAERGHVVLMCGPPGSGRPPTPGPWRRAATPALIEIHGCRWELVHLKADADTLLRRLAVRNSGTRSANRVTVCDELLERYAAGFEEPVGEGERVVLQE
ncbi:hypothetical protein [Streptomyces sp. H34-S4]|uniref:hypothetical protein n=1 Tax=Streptomyces sp. H34-S4 TaxID=2996463 RepID=UPI00226F3EC0|nr:hypothetical protein [Streptomyces sp. H34-S4]MCY0933994.1 hypothetical protein [Streptomyces sp. H34-S4]